MQSKRTPVEPVDDVVIVKTASVPIAPATCFQLFLDTQHVASWLCKKAHIEARIGGRYELMWEPEDPQNNSTIGCRITAYERDRLLAFQWRSPKQFKDFANAADPLTHVVVAFHGAHDETVVTLVHSGWRSTPDWQQAAQWQHVAWDYAFRALAGYAQSMTHTAAPSPR